MNQLYKYEGITRQAIDQYGKRQQLFNKKLLCLLSEVEELSGYKIDKLVTKKYRWNRICIMRFSSPSLWERGRGEAAAL